MTATTGLFVLDVAEARAVARDGGTGLVEHGGDTVAITYSDGTYAVESVGLFTDGALEARVRSLLSRHG